MNDHHINVGIQILPLEASQKAYEFIDRAISNIQNSGLKYEVTAMETLIEGKYDDVMTVVKNSQNAAMEAGAKELVVSIRLHIKKGQDVHLEDKTKKFK